MLHEIPKEILGLPDGRSLAYLSLGTAESPVVFYFHGQPSSAREAYLWEEGAAQIPVRLISVDRPGVGESSYQDNRRVEDFVDDMKHLIIHLGVQTYRILAVSGGCPYGLACAALLPSSQLRGVAIVGGLASAEFGTKGASLYQKFAISCTSAVPLLVGPFIRFAFAPAARIDTDKLTEAMASGLRTAELGDGVEVERVARIMAVAFKECFASGSRGYSLEAKLCVQRWTFDLGAITSTAKLDLWYGGEDDVTPVAIGEQLAARIAGSRLHVKSQADHTAIVLCHQLEILSALCQRS